MFFSQTGSNVIRGIGANEETFTGVHTMQWYQSVVLKTAQYGPSRTNQRTQQDIH